jgi:hypothetical protein
MQGNTANAQMKAVTKGKRRLTLSLCGLGWLDETEIETIPSARPVTVVPETGEIVTGEIIDPEPTTLKQTTPAPAPEPSSPVAWPGDYGLTIPVMVNIGEAENELNEKGVPYSQIEHNVLLIMANRMAQTLQKGEKSNGTKLIEDDYTKYYRKLSAIKTILTAK